MLNCANAPKKIGVKGFEERELSTCEQQWNTSNICKRNPAGIFHAEKNQKDCGSLPPPCGDWGGLNPPVFSSDKKVVGATTNVLCK